MIVIDASNPEMRRDPQQVERERQYSKSSLGELGPTIDLAVLQLRAEARKAQEPQERSPQLVKIYCRSAPKAVLNEGFTWEVYAALPPDLFIVEAYGKVAAICNTDELMMPEKLM